MHAERRKFVFESFIFFCAVILIQNRSCIFLKLTNLDCVALDKPFADFRHCHLKVLSRGVIALNVHVELYQTPVSNVSIELSLWKKTSRYLPFLPKVSGDFCSMLKNRKRKSFLNILLDMLLPVSNINQTCPYDHDIIVKDWVLRSADFKFLPLPNGQYRISLKVGAYNQWKADIKVYILVNEEWKL